MGLLYRALLLWRVALDADAEAADAAAPACKGAGALLVALGAAAHTVEVPYSTWGGGAILDRCNSCW
jgi:hypothetical protein